MEIKHHHHHHHYRHHHHHQSTLLSKNLYLEHKELLAEDGQGVEASITDVGYGVGVGGLGPLWRAVGSGMAVMLAGVRGRVEARRWDRGWGPGWLRCSVWWTLKENNTQSVILHPHCSCLQCFDHCTFNFTMNDLASSADSCCFENDFLADPF